MKTYSAAALLAAALLLSVHAGRAQETPTLYVGEHSTTHILFTTDLTYVDISNPGCIAAKVVEASKNMLALKASQKFDYVTTISALEANGTMHTFKVMYDSFPEQLVVDTRRNIRMKGDGSVSSVPSGDGGGVLSGNPGGDMSGTGGTGTDVAGRGANSNFGRRDAPTIREIIGKKQEVFHIGDKVFGVEVYCTNIFVYSDITYIVLTIFNNTDVGFDAGEAQFTVETLKRSSKALATDRSIWPKSSFGTLSCAPRSRAVIGYTIPKTTLLKNECLRIYIYEKSGKRNLILTLTDKDVNYAVSPK